MSMISSHVSAAPPSAVAALVLPFIDAAAEVITADELESIREDYESGEYAIAVAEAAAALVQSGRSVDQGALQAALDYRFPEFADTWLRRL